MIKSKFKITMLFVGILCFAFLAIAIFKMFQACIDDFDQVANSYLSENLITKIIIAFGAIGFLWTPIYLIKYFKTLRIYPTNIEVDYLFPIFNHNLQLKDFDYYVLIDEMTRNIPVEAIWFIKDDKVKLIFPGQLYSNYYEIRQEISKYKIENRGKVKLNPLQEIKARLGFKINKLENIK